MRAYCRSDTRSRAPTASCSPSGERPRLWISTGRNSIRRGEDRLEGDQIPDPDDIAAGRGHRLGVAGHAHCRDLARHPQRVARVATAALEGRCEVDHPQRVTHRRDQLGPIGHEGQEAHGPVQIHRRAQRPARGQRVEMQPVVAGRHHQRVATGRQHRVGHRQRHWQRQAPSPPRRRVPDRDPPRVDQHESARRRNAPAAVSLAGIGISPSTRAPVIGSSTAPLPRHSAPARSRCRAGPRRPPRPGPGSVRVARRRWSRSVSPSVPSTASQAPGRAAKAVVGQRQDGFDGGHRVQPLGRPHPVAQRVALRRGDRPHPADRGQRQRQRDRHGAADLPHLRRAMPALK